MMDGLAFLRYNTGGLAYVAAGLQPVFVTVIYADMKKICKNITFLIGAFI